MFSHSPLVVGDLPAAEVTLALRQSQINYFFCWSEKEVRGMEQERVGLVLRQIEQEIRSHDKDKEIAAYAGDRNLYIYHEGYVDGLFVAIAFIQAVSRIT